MLSIQQTDLQQVGSDLEDAVKIALAALEQSGIPARAADEFIRECVFNAWWDWDYEPADRDPASEPCCDLYPDCLHVVEGSA